MSCNENTLAIRLASVAAALTLGTAAHAATLDVPGTYATIQDAIDAAADGDVVLLADGTYSEDLEILDKKILLRSNSEDPALCSVDGGFSGIVLMGAATDSTIRGIKFTNASRAVEINADASARFESCIMENSSISGIFMNGVKLTMVDCIVRENDATNSGGGMTISSGDVKLRGCLFRDNAVTGFNAQGGGINVGGTAELLIVDSTFRRNTAIGSNLGQGGAIRATGGASPFVIVNTRFEENEASDEGGGISLVGRAARLGNVEFRQNSAADGGAMYLDGTAPDAVTVANALFSGNDALNGNGGAFYLDADAVLDATNVTVVANDASGLGGGLYGAATSDATFLNSILRGNSPQELFSTGPVQVSYSNVEGGYAGPGNIDVSAQFVSVVTGDFHLAADSPCIDAGHTALYWGPPTDPDGFVRAVNDPDRPDDGVELTTGAIDMGAYEYQPTDSCLADADGDGSVGFADLVLLLSTWGPCP